MRPHSWPSMYKKKTNDLRSSARFDKKPWAQVVSIPKVMVHSTVYHLAISVKKDGGCAKKPDGLNSSDGAREFQLSRILKFIGQVERSCFSYPP